MVVFKKLFQAASLFLTRMVNTAGLAFMQTPKLSFDCTPNPGFTAASRTRFLQHSGLKICCIVTECSFEITCTNHSSFVVFFFFFLVLHCCSYNSLLYVLLYLLHNVISAVYCGLCEFTFVEPQWPDFFFNVNIFCAYRLYFFFLIRYCHSLRCNQLGSPRYRVVYYLIHSYEQVQHCKYLITRVLYHPCVI